MRSLESSHSDKGIGKLSNRTIQNENELGESKAPWTKLNIGVIDARPAETLWGPIVPIDLILIIG